MKCKRVIRMITKCRQLQSSCQSEAIGCMGHVFDVYLGLLMRHRERLFFRYDNERIYVLREADNESNKNLKPRSQESTR